MEINNFMSEDGGRLVARGVHTCESVYERGDALKIGSNPFVGMLTRPVDGKSCNQDVAL